MDSGSGRKARSPSSSLAIPESPNDSSEPNNGSSSSAKTQEMPGPISCTYASSRPQSQDRSAKAWRASWGVTIISRTPAPSTRCCHCSAVALIATGKPSSLAAVTASAALPTRRNGSIVIP